MDKEKMAKPKFHLHYSAMQSFVIIVVAAFGLLVVLQISAIAKTAIEGTLSKRNEANLPSNSENLHPNSRISERDVAQPHSEVVETTTTMTTTGAPTTSTTSPPPDARTHKDRSRLVSHLAAEQRRISAGIGQSGQSIVSAYNDINAPGVDVGLVAEGDFIDSPALYPGKTGQEQASLGSMHQLKSGEAAGAPGMVNANADLLGGLLDLMQNQPNYREDTLLSEPKPVVWKTPPTTCGSSFVPTQMPSDKYKGAVKEAKSDQGGQGWYGCGGCCGYVAGAAGWSCCRIRGALYSACFNNTDCTVLNSQCILGCCQCPYPFYRQNACQQCELIPRVLGAQCATTADCARDVFRAVCVNGVCQCATAYKSACVNGVCQCVPRCLGDQCAQDLDCSINVANSVCSGGTCQCAAGFSPNVCGQCVPGQPLGAPPLGGITGR